MGSVGANKATNARSIENMNEAQLNREIAKEQRRIENAEKTMDKNNIANTAEAKAMQQTFPGGVGGDGWSVARRRAFNSGIERDTKKAAAFSQAVENKQSSEIRLKNLQDAKKQISGTRKTLKQVNDEAVQKAVSSTQSTLKWKTTQKESYNNGAYRPKIISAGKFEIQGSNGLYTIYENGKVVGRTDKLAKAKAFAERRKK